MVDAAVTGVRVVKGFGQEEQELERLEEASERLFAGRVRTVRLMAKYNPALQAIPSLGQIGVLALGGWLAIHGSITLGTFLAFSSYLVQLVGPVRMLTNLVTIGQEARASVIRVFEVIDSRPVVTEKPGAAELPAGAAAVEFEDVQFGYVPSQPVLRGLTLRVSSLARRWPSSACQGLASPRSRCCSRASTTFAAARSGWARRDIRDLTLDSLRAAIGLVLEESFLFSDTVRANIAYGRPDATERAGASGGKCGGGRRVHQGSAAGLRHCHRRAGAHPVRWSASAGGARPRADHRSAHPSSRRRDVGGRPARGGRNPRHLGPG